MKRFVLGISLHPQQQQMLRADPNTAINRTV